MLERMILTDKKIDIERERENAARQIAKLKDDYQAIKAEYVAIVAKNEDLSIENRALTNECRIAREILAQLKARIDALQSSVNSLRHESEKLHSQIIDECAPAMAAGANFSVTRLDCDIGDAANM